MPTKYREWWRIAEFQIFGAEIWNAREPNSRLYRGTQSWKSQNLMNINDGSDLLRLTSTDANCIFSPVITGSDWDRHCLFLWLILELFVLIVCHFTEMTSLDQHVLMNMQKSTRPATLSPVQSKWCRFGRLCRWLVGPWQQYWFLSKVLLQSTLLPVCTGLNLYFC